MAHGGSKKKSGHGAKKVNANEKRNIRLFSKFELPENETALRYLSMLNHAEKLLQIAQNNPKEIADAVKKLPNETLDAKSAVVCMMAFNEAETTDVLVLDVPVEKQNTEFAKKAFIKCKCLEISNQAALDSLARENRAGNRMFGNVEEIVIGDGIKNIPDGAFQMYEKLKSISGGKDVEFIGRRAVAGCARLKKFDCSGGDGVEIERTAFEGCGMANPKPAEPIAEEQEKTVPVQARESLKDFSRAEAEIKKECAKNTEIPAVRGNLVIEAALAADGNGGEHRLKKTGEKIRPESEYPLRTRRARPTRGFLDENPGLVLVKENGIYRAVEAQSLRYNISPSGERLLECLQVVDMDAMRERMREAKGKPPRKIIVCGINLNASHGMCSEKKQKRAGSKEL